MLKLQKETKFKIVKRYLIPLLNLGADERTGEEGRKVGRCTGAPTAVAKCRGGRRGIQRSLAHEEREGNTREEDGAQEREERERRGERVTAKPATRWCV